MVWWKPYSGVNKAQEQGALLLRNDKENWGKWTKMLSPDVFLGFVSNQTLNLGNGIMVFARSPNGMTHDGIIVYRHIKVSKFGQHACSACSV